MRHRILKLIASCAAAFLAGAPVSAQYETTPDGRLLENSPQVGSAGYNTPVQQPDFLSGNRIITGNVGGLGYFHGSVPYRAPGEYLGNLPSERLFRFHAQSVPSNYVGLSQPYSSMQPSVAIYRPGSAVNLQQVPTTPNAFTQLTPRLDGRVRYNEVEALPRERTLLQRPLQVDDRVDSLGVFRGESGDLLEVTASPLLGLRQQQIGPGGQPRQVPGTQPLEPESDVDIPQPGSQLPEPVPGLPVDPAAPGPVRVGSGLDPSGRLGDGLPATRVGQLTGMQTAQQAAVMPAEELGLQLQAALVPPRFRDRGVTTLDDRVRQIEARMFSPLGQVTAKPGEDVYMDRLREVQRNREIAAGRGRAEVGGHALVPGRPVEAKVDPEKLPTAEELAAAEEARRRAMLAARGFEPSESAPTLLTRAERRAATRRELAEAAAPAAVEADDALQRQARDQAAQPGDEAAEAPPAELDEPQLPPAMAQMLKTLNYRLPEVRSMAGSRQTRVNDLLREAEELIRSNKFFEADERYRRVLAIQPDHVMARAGMINAQLGAGLLRSAAITMRQFYAEHPELIATRYDVSLLPPNDRINWVLDELDKMIRTSGLAEPAILKAYLGYQMSSPKLTKIGLDVAQARLPRDPLITLLREVWLDERPSQ